MTTVNSREVRAIITRPKNGKVLLVLEKARTETDQWTLPGGLAENGGNPVTAINRLLKSLFSNLQHEIPFIFYQPSVCNSRESIAVLIVRIQGRVIPNGEDLAELQWVEVVDALNGHREYNLPKTLQETLVKFQRLRGERPPEILP